MIDGLIERQTMEETVLLYMMAKCSHIDYNGRGKE